MASPEQPPQPLLFLIGDTGGGHRSAAAAVAQALERALPGRFVPVIWDPLRGPDVARPLGQLHIEPYAIVFTRRAKGSQTIRVSQPGWRGHYKMTTTCNLVSVNLRKYGPGSVSFWDAARIAHGKERCRITFVGSRGPRGTNSVEIRVLRRK